MKKRYNIALLPISKSNEFISFAKNLYNIADEYRLGDNSLPHLTLCQFMAAESDVEDIWKKVCETLIDHSIELTLKDFSCLTIDNSSWVSLLPDNTEKLMKMHCSVASLIGDPIGRCFEKYDAHLTLINTKQKNYNNIVLSFPCVPIRDVFKLSLGTSDEIGQYKKILYCQQ
jgi:2'-5' RNA ligase